MFNSLCKIVDNFHDDLDEYEKLIKHTLAAC